jgi:hypothetical protein
MEITYVCSLGPFCHTASFLKRNQLKMASYPFDWVFSKLDIVDHCIQDDFKIFLDKSYYVDNGSKWHDNQCGHTKYHINMFNHHDLRKEKDYSYFVRCVDRFRELLQKKEHKLFMFLFPNGEYNSHTESFKDSIIAFNNTLKANTSNYTLLCIISIPHKEFPLAKFSKVDNIDFLELHTVSKSDGIKFKEESDNVYMDTVLLNKYRFNLHKLYTETTSSVEEHL